MIISSHWQREDAFDENKYSKVKNKPKYWVRLNLYA
jgi:hypothetical protein